MLHSRVRGYQGQAAGEGGAILNFAAAGDPRPESTEQFGT